MHRLTPSLGPETLHSGLAGWDRCGDHWAVGFTSERPSPSLWLKKLPRSYGVVLSSAFSAVGKMRPHPPVLPLELVRPSNVKSDQHIRLQTLRAQIVCRGWLIFNFLWGFVNSLNPNPYLEHQGITLCLVSTLRPVRHGWPYREFKTPADISLGVTETLKPSHRDKVVTLGKQYIVLNCQSWLDNTS